MLFVISLTSNVTISFTSFLTAYPSSVKVKYFARISLGTFLIDLDGYSPFFAYSIAFLFISLASMLHLTPLSFAMIAIVYGSSPLAQPILHLLATEQP